MHKKSLLFIILTIIVILAGCSGASNTNSDAKQDSDKFVMKIGHTLSAESPRHQILEEFKKQVEEKTDAKVTVEIYPSNQLGDNNQLLQAVPLGNVQAAVQPSAFFGGIQDKLSVVDIPFIWKGMNHIGDVLGGETGEKVLSTLEDKGMKGLAFWPIGMKVVTSNKSIESLQELKGQKFRTMGTPVLLDVFSSWGTSPTAIAIPELYSSLQQGVIDGQENDIGTIHDLKLYEVQKYMLPLYHGAVIDVFYVNKKWFDGLPQEFQKVLKETATTLITNKIEKELQVVDQKLKTIETSGKVTTLEVSESLVNDMREKSEAVKEEFIKKYPDMEPILSKIEK